MGSLCLHLDFLSWLFASMPVAGGDYKAGVRVQYRGLLE